MPYVPTFNRDQMLVCFWDSFVDPGSVARLIDAFVNSLDLRKYEVKEAAKEGRPAYDSKGLRKVTGEFALFCLGYNIERAKNLLGYDKMMELIAGA